MYGLDINLFVSLNYLFYFAGSLRKLLAIHFFKCLSSQKNDCIFHIFDEIRFQGYRHHYM